ncbi:SPW repeat protein [Allostreptomyces psammosilenae]|uniref:SPW repeat-containing integral membrane domain-containing protein n=1 Tax=Allostreptomyces psammosilenae TaxID=1892865 RepID=A0A852ZSP7_9ACTN|nr:SPW repeat protein [Allostreptomyces psammosilenae]NYI05359.1 hypothetical protein [Allostreptomyces psammosilenae]
MATQQPGIEQHPDLVGLHAHAQSPAERFGRSPASQALQGLTLLTGIWMAISPWVVGFEGLNRLAISNLVVGIAYTVLALGFAGAFERTHGLGWAAALLGAWMIVSPWLVAGDVSTTRTVVNNVITGALAALLGLATAAMGLMRGRKRSR